MKEIKEKKSKKEKPLESDKPNNTVIENDKMSNSKAVTRDFDYVKSEAAYMENSTIDNERGVRVKLYQEENNGELLLLMLRSYAEDIAETLENHDSFSRGVELNKAKAGFQLSKGSSSGCHPGSSVNGGNVYGALFAALSDLGLPTGLLGEAINGSRGYLTVDNSNILPYLEIKAGSNLELDFDDIYLPFFIIGLNASGGRVRGNFYAEMQYKEKYYIPSNGYVYNYYESDRAKDYFSLDVTD